MPLSSRPATERISLESMGIATGNGHCGKVVSDDLDACDASVLGAMTEGFSSTLSGPEVTADTAVPRPDGEQCLISAGGAPVGVPVFGNEPVAREDVSLIAESAGCDSSIRDGGRDGRVVECEEFVAWLWRMTIPAADLAWFDNGMGIIGTLLLFRPLPVAPADDDQPFSMESADFLASIEAHMSAMDALVEGVEFRLGVPSEALPGRRGWHGWHEAASPAAAILPLRERWPSG